MVGGKGKDRQGMLLLPTFPPKGDVDRLTL